MSGLKSRFTQEGTTLVGPDGNVVTGSATLALEWDDAAKAYRSAVRASVAYMQALYAANGNHDQAWEKAGLEFWMAATRVYATGYPGIEDGEVADRAAFVSDPLRREHAILHGWTAIQQIKGRDSAEILPLQS